MSLLWTFLAVGLAFGAGRSMIIWPFLAYTFGGWALLPIIFLPSKTYVLERRLQNIQTFNQKLEARLKPEGYEDFNTVDDLIKQLETK
jgi:hypothetical protein